MSCDTVVPRDHQHHHPCNTISTIWRFEIGKRAKSTSDALTTHCITSRLFLSLFPLYLFLCSSSLLLRASERYGHDILGHWVVPLLAGFGFGYYTWSSLRCICIPPRGYLRSWKTARMGIGVFSLCLCASLNDWYGFYCINVGGWS